MVAKRRRRTAKRRYITNKAVPKARKSTAKVASKKVTTAVKAVKAVEKRVEKKLDEAKTVLKKADKKLAQAKKVAKAPKVRKSARVKRYARLGAPAMPKGPAWRGAFVPWAGRKSTTKSVSYTRTTKPGWRGFGGYKTKAGKSVDAGWRLFENRKPRRRRSRKARNAGYRSLPRRGAGGRFLKRGLKANRKVRRGRKTTRRIAKGRFTKRSSYRSNKGKSRKGTRRSWLSKTFGWKKNEGVGTVVDTMQSLVKPGLAAAAGFFLARIAGNYVRNTFQASESRPIRIMAPMLANVGVALAAWYVPREIGALSSLKPYSEPMAVGAMVGLVETILTQFGGTFVQSYVAPPASLGDSLDVYERALRGMGEGGWNDYNPSDDYLLSTLADDDGISEYITEPLGEYITEPLEGLGEYVTEPDYSGELMLESSTGIETGIYGPGVSDLGVEVEEAVAGVPIEAEEGLATHIFGGAAGNGLFGMGADMLTPQKVAMKAKLVAIQGLKSGLRPVDAAKNAYAAVKSSEGVTNGSAALRAAVVAGVKEALQSCGVCKPQRAGLKFAVRRPVAPMVTGPRQCREVCSSTPTTKPGLRLVGGAPMLTQHIGAGGVSDDLSDDMSGGGIFGSSML